MLDAVFLIGLFLLIQGIKLARRPDAADAVNTIAVLSIVFFVVGIYRGWELIGGPSFGIAGELRALIRGPETADGTVETAAPDADRAWGRSGPAWRCTPSPSTSPAVTRSGPPPWCGDGR
jgi:hypothetical protein